MSPVCEKTYTLDDQIRFAALSGDDNAIHVNPEAARRTLYGEVIVHGANLVMTALNAVALEFSEPVRSIDARFSRPAFTGRVTSFLCESKRTGVEIRVSQSGETISTIDVMFGSRSSKSDSGAPSSSDFHRIPVDVDSNLFRKSFPEFAEVPGAGDFYVVLAASKVVGTVEPGEHSLFTRLQFQVSERADCDEFLYRIHREVPQVGLVNLQIRYGCFTGTIEAYRRPEPVYQKATNELFELTAGYTAGSQRPVVVGGSRGLGEVFAKLLALGGSDVTLTYFKGGSDAERIASEGREEGLSISTAALDVTSADQIEHLLARSDGPQYDALYFFASPKIMPGNPSRFDAKLYAQMSETYVDAFRALAEGILQGGGTRVFYPSTVFIDERPKKFKEYVAAKEAGERVCDELKVRYPAAQIFAPRIPRVRTDQNQGLLKTDDIKETERLALHYLRDFDVRSPHSK